MQPDWNFTPQQALAVWPDAQPLAALVTGATHEQWGRVSALAEPAETHALEWLGPGPEAAEKSMRALQEILARHEPFEVGRPPSASSANDACSAAPWRRGLWIVALAYEWGGLVEPSAMPRHRAPPDGWPLAVLCWCPHPLVYLHGTRQWVADPTASALGNAIARRLESGAAPDTAGAVISGFDADEARAAFESAVARVVEYVRAGDIFQANVAQRFSARWEGSPRAIARAAFVAGEPRYGAYLETSRIALASMSPELFLEAHSSGAALSRPVKGTRARHEDPAALLQSEKDAAELHMIVDLMRNDLGRLSLPGTVQVTQARGLESHATVHHGVAEIRSQLRAGTAVPDLLRAAFPPGSVTGAPKVRAMQVIDELETVSRGPYCGAVGAIDAESIALNVAIRTVCMHRDEPGAPCGTLRYSAGCGVVADSIPKQEYEESLHKTAVMLHAAHALRRRT